MSANPLESPPDRRGQILRAAMICFAQRGFHQASMHNISAEAGISVGLIYRYFENKEDMSSQIAERHKKRIHSILELARQAPSLLESLEVLFTAHCSEDAPHITAAFVVDLFAEASRNPRVAELVRDVCETTRSGVTDLIARSPEVQNAPRDLTPRQIAELIFAVNDGMLMREVLQVSEGSDDERRQRQLKALRSLWRLLFTKETKSAYA